MPGRATIGRRGRREEIKSRLRTWIRQDGLQPGDRLLPQRELAAMLETTEVTTHRVLTEMAEAGEVYRVRGQGTFVGPDPESRTPGGTVTLVLAGRDLDQPRNNPEYWPIVQSISRAFMSGAGAQRPFQMLPVTEDDDLAAAARRIESSTAVFFHYHQEPRALIDLLIERGRVPVICMGPPHPNMPCMTIDHDRLAGAHRAAGYLVQQGYRRIGLIASRMPYGEAMCDGYRTALTDADIALEPTRIERCGESRADAADAAGRLLARVDCDAILVDADMRAMGVLDQLHQQSIAVPDDLGLMGYEGLDFTCFHPPHLSSLEIPWADLIAAALSDVQALDSTRTPQKHIEMIGRIVPGRTTLS